MKDQTFHCHMCEQILTGKPKMRVALMGFVWEPMLNDNPSELLDICEPCQYSLLKAYAKAKNDRIEAVYEKNKITWLREKINGLDRAKAGKLSGSARRSRFSPAEEIAGDRARWNYNKKEIQKTWGF